LWLVVVELFGWRKTISLREGNAILKFDSVRKLFGGRELLWPALLIST